MQNALTLYTGDDLRALLIPSGASKDRRSRLGKFADWLTMTRRTWNTPDLAAYRDALLGGDLGYTYTPGSVNAHLATVRRRYRGLLKEERTRATLYARAGELLRD